MDLRNRSPAVRREVVSEHVIFRAGSAIRALRARLAGTGEGRPEKRADESHRRYPAGARAEALPLPGDGISHHREIEWFHSIDLGDGEVSKGVKSATELE